MVSCPLTLCTHTFHANLLGTTAAKYRIQKQNSDLNVLNAVWKWCGTQMKNCTTSKEKMRILLYVFRLQCFVEMSATFYDLSYFTFCVLSHLKIWYLLKKMFSSTTSMHVSIAAYKMTMESRSAPLMMHSSRSFSSGRAFCNDSCSLRGC